ncbi:MAG: choice-of-anchor K domain-containing protein [bacterium]|nr:choice-of-anchor K domain-containing protein [bacterium]
MSRKLSVLLMLILLLVVSEAAALGLNNVDGVWIGSNAGSTPPACLRIQNTVTNQTDENILAYGDGREILNNNQCTMGSVPNLDRQSGFGFDGVNRITEFRPGDPFLIGEFKHYNNPLYPNAPLRTAQMRLNLSFSSPALNTSLNYTFRLDETPNSPPCPYGGDVFGCFDRVDFESTITEDTFVIDGVVYTLQIAGFVRGRAPSCRFNPAQVVEAFITAEQAVNTACLFGRLLVAAPSITLTKTLDQVNPVPLGSDVSFTIVTQNTGNTLLRNIDLDDELSTGGGCDTFQGPLDDIDDNRVLSPGETWRYLCGVNDVTQDFTNFATIEAVAFIESRTITVRAEDDAEVQVQAPLLTSLVVNKQVDWNGATPFDSTFQICVSGPSFPGGQCDPYSAGTTITYNNLTPGDYTVTETDPGAAWAIGGSPATVTMVGGQPQTVNVTNTLRRGSLTVNKQVLWNNAAPQDDAAFTICISGPSYPTGSEAGACQQVMGADGGSLTWSDLITGTYTVSEQFPGVEWTVSYEPQSVVVPAGGSASATVINSRSDDVVCEGRDLLIDLSGVITVHDGFAVGTITNNGDARCDYRVGMASYRKYNEVIDDQEIFAWINPVVTIPAGETVELTIGLPPCAAQVDLFYGDYLPNLSGIRYGERLLDAIHIGGEDYCITTDTDGDGVDDALDTDDDGDGIPDGSDPAPLEFNDLDGDGLGDGVDEDLDGDGLPNLSDAQPTIFDDLDGDGLGDGVDEDIDGDGLLNDADAEPLMFNDLDRDGIGDGTDDDIDGDGLPNDADAEPLVFNDLDLDGIGDGADEDMDGDGLPNATDAEPLVFNDLDGDRIGDGLDDDADGDGFTNPDEVTAGTNPLDATSFPTP